jgi:hypothetical protein
MCYKFLSNKLQSNFPNRVKFAIFQLIFKFICILDVFCEDLNLFGIGKNKRNGIGPILLAARPGMGPIAHGHSGEPKATWAGRDVGALASVRVARAYRRWRG